MERKNFFFLVLILFISIFAFIDAKKKKQIEENELFFPYHHASDSERGRAPRLSAPTTESDTERGRPAPRRVIAQPRRVVAQPRRVIAQPRRVVAPRVIPTRVQPRRVVAAPRVIPRRPAQPKRVIPTRVQPRRVVAPKRVAQPARRVAQPARKQPARRVAQPARKQPARKQPARKCNGRGCAAPKPAVKPTTPQSKHPKTLDDRSIWNKYRTRLAYEVAKRFCGGKTDCDYTAKTAFQLITTSMTATWNQDKNQLNKDVAGFAPAWEISYKPMTTSQDGVFSEIYKKYLLSSKNLSQYKAFMSKQPEKNGLFYDWEESAPTLKQFVDSASSKPENTVGFSFNINLSTDENLKNSWATLGSGYNGEKGFIRTFTKDNMPLADLEGHFDTQSDSNFIFGSRTVYHHVYQTRTVVIKTNKFDFKMDATALGTINIQPSKQWFDKTEFMNNVAARKENGFTGPYGKLPLIPTSVVVAYKPKVEIVVSKSVYEDIQHSVKDTQVLGWLVGGARFRAPQIKALNDDGSIEYFSKEEMANGIYKDQADEIIIEKLDEPKHASFSGAMKDKDLEEYFDETSKYGQLAQADSEYNTERRASAKADSEAKWFWRRRTRHVTVVHTVEKKVDEGNYKITWISNNNVPQILGVISERV